MAGTLQCSTCSLDLVLDLSRNGGPVWYAMPRGAASWRCVGTSLRHEPDLSNTLALERWLAALPQGVLA